MTVEPVSARRRSTGVGVLGLLCALVPPVALALAITVAAAGASDIFYVWLALAVVATGVTIVLLVVLRRRQAGGWFTGVLTALILAGVLGYGGWILVGLLDAATRSGGTV